MARGTRYVPEYWSSCCGQKVEYIGYYRCTACQQRALFGALPSVAAEQAKRIREEIAARKAEEEEEEGVAGGCLF